MLQAPRVKSLSLSARTQPLVFEYFGLSKSEIGVLMSLQPVMSLFSSPIFGSLADITGRPAAVMTGCVLGAVTLRMALMLVPALAGAAKFWVAFLLVLSGEFVGSPIGSILDNSCLAILKKLNISSSMYGRQRLWGAIGWGLAAVIVGQIVDSTSIYATFFAHMTMEFLSLFFVLRYIPRQPPRSKLAASSNGVESLHAPLDAIELATSPDAAALIEPNASDSNAEQATNGDAKSSSHDSSDKAGNGAANSSSSAMEIDPNAGVFRSCALTVRVLFSNGRNVAFFFIVLSLGVLYSLPATFLFLYLGELGGTRELHAVFAAVLCSCLVFVRAALLFGLSLTVTCAIEAPVFFVSDVFIRKLGLLGVLYFALGCARCPQLAACLFTAVLLLLDQAMWSACWVTR